MKKKNTDRLARPSGICIGVLYKREGETRWTAGFWREEVEREKKKGGGGRRELCLVLRYYYNDDHGDNKLLLPLPLGDSAKSGRCDGVK